MRTFLRVLKNSWKNFYRNLWLSLATLGMMLMAMLLLGSLILFNASIEVFVKGLEEKVDVSIYFAADAEEDDILGVMRDLEQKPEIAEVRYISRNEALDIFQNRHSDNTVLIDSLKELEENPLQASLNIKVHESEQFAGVVSYLESSAAAPLIDDINFRENEKVITRISSIAANVSRVGWVTTGLLALFVFFVTYNTIRLAIYTSKDEIYIMKLVGASNWFVRGPFIISGTLYGVVAAAFTLGALLGGTWLLGEKISIVFGEINLFDYLMANILLISAELFAAGIILGGLSSYFAARRYLKV